MKSGSPPKSIGLRRDEHGRLMLERHEGAVTPSRAFPIHAPHEGIALLNAEGKEVLWLESLDPLPEDERDLLLQELASREFMPRVRAIKSVSSYATPCDWSVITDRGETLFTLNGEEHIRRIGHKALLIADNHGIQFLIEDRHSLDRTSRKILDRFL